MAAGIADPAPETAQTFARALAPAGHQAMGQYHRIHGAGTGAADGINLQASIFEQPVQHAPGECAMGTTALQGEVDALDAA